MTKNYYKILGVSEFDTQENIKSAYRNLARKLHPDIAGSTQEALNRFKEINEAYEILSNSTKKADYDRAMSFYNFAKCNSKPEDASEKKEAESKTTKTETKKSGQGAFAFNWENFIRRKKTATTFKQQGNSVPQKGNDVFTEIEITEFEAVTGATKVINMLQSLPCPKCKGKKFINNTTCPHCKGKGFSTTYKKFNVRIPAGIKNNSKIRLSGEGANGINGGKNGDLYVTIHVKENVSAQTNGSNVLKTIAISPFEAVLGTEVRISVFGQHYSVKIAPNTQNGQKIRLSGCGIVQNSKVGDIILTVEIKIPKKISPQELELYKKLAEISTINVRENDYD